MQQFDVGFSCIAYRCGFHIILSTHDASLSAFEKILFVCVDFRAYKCIVQLCLPFEMTSLKSLFFQDDQPDVQGLAVLLSTERCATQSPIGMISFSVWHLPSVSEDWLFLSTDNNLTRKHVTNTLILENYYQTLNCSIDPPCVQIGWVSCANLVIG